MEAVPANLTWSGDTPRTRLHPRGRAGQARRGHRHPGERPAQFGGDPARWNPEDLLAGTLAHCHMLTFLALAAKARLQVLGYQDRAEATLVTEDRICRVGEILLQPTITVAPGTDPAKVAELFQKAHKYCTIANSLTARVAMRPRVVEG